MRNRFTGSILTIVAVLAFSPVLLAQTPSVPRSGGAKSTPDLSGTWDASSDDPVTGPGAFTTALPAGRGGIPIFGFTSEEPPMQSWALEKLKATRGGRGPTERGREETDPVMYPYCMPHGFPRVYTSPLAIEIVQAPDRVYMFFEASHLIRRIFTDGRKHLEGWGPTFMGTSHGRWDGDTLVVETDSILSLNKQAWLDNLAHPFTDALRVTERLRRVAQETLQIDFTFDDPGAYTKPWTGRKVFRLKPDREMTDFIICETHMQEDFSRDLRNGKPAGKP